MTNNEFMEEYGGGDHEVFKAEDLDKFFTDIDNLIKKGHADALTPEEFQSVEKATSDAKDLKKVSVIDGSGSPVVMYVRKKK